MMLGKAVKAPCPITVWFFNETIVALVSLNRSFHTSRTTPRQGYQRIIVRNIVIDHRVLCPEEGSNAISTPCFAVNKNEKEARGYWSISDFCPSQSAVSLHASRGLETMKYHCFADRIVEGITDLEIQKSTDSARATEDLATEETAFHT